MKATLYIATSLNGMITKGKTNSDWVSEVDADNFDRICQEHGCILVGGNTFRQYQDEIYPIEDTANIVLSSQEYEHSYEQTYFENNFKSAIEKIETLGYDRFLIAGGADIAKQCLEAKLVDKVFLSLHPLIFSNGLNMAENFGYDAHLEFQQIVQTHPEFLLIEYNVKET